VRAVGDAEVGEGGAGVEDEGWDGVRLDPGGIVGLAGRHGADGQCRLSRRRDRRSGVRSRLEEPSIARLLGNPGVELGSRHSSSRLDNGNSNKIEKKIDLIGTSQVKGAEPRWNYADVSCGRLGRTVHCNCVSAEVISHNPEQEARTRILLTFQAAVQSTLMNDNPYPNAYECITTTIQLPDTNSSKQHAPTSPAPLPYPDSSACAAPRQVPSHPSTAAPWSASGSQPSLQTHRL
jgi:hypothetical protein